MEIEESKKGSICLGGKNERESKFQSWIQEKMEERKTLNFCFKKTIFLSFFYFLSN